MRGAGIKADMHFVGDPLVLVKRASLLVSATTKYALLAAESAGARFAVAYEFSIRTVQEWERGAKKPSGPARTLLRAIKADPEGLRKALAAA